MKRCFARFLTALSLLLCLAVCGLWVRSEATSDGVLGTSFDGDLCWVIVRRGRVGMLKIGPWPYPVPLRWRPVPAAAPQIGPWIAMRDEWLSYGDEPLGDLLAARHVRGLAQIENRDDGWTDYGPCPVRQYTHAPPGARYRIVQMSLLPAVFLTAPLPIVWAVIALPLRLQRRRRRYLGLCPACAYDLRATPGRCPECGTAAGTPA